MSGLVPGLWPTSISRLAANPSVLLSSNPARERLSRTLVATDHVASVAPGTASFANV